MAAPRILVKKAEVLNRCLSCGRLFEDDKQGPRCVQCRAQAKVKRSAREEPHQSPSQ
jgi:DNA-directed RNA polymerase subunit RPC12/RpoP